MWVFQIVKRVLEDNTLNFGGVNLNIELKSILDGEKLLRVIQKLGISRNLDVIRYSGKIVNGRVFLSEIEQERVEEVDLGGNYFQHELPEDFADTLLHDKYQNILNIEFFNKF